MRVSILLLFGFVIGIVYARNINPSVPVNETSCTKTTTSAPPEIPATFPNFDADSNGTRVVMSAVVASEPLECSTDGEVRGVDGKCRARVAIDI
jgi:hypothetical protein